MAVSVRPLFTQNIMMVFAFSRLDSDPRNRRGISSAKSFAQRESAGSAS